MGTDMCMPFMDLSFKREPFLFHLSSFEDTVSGILPALWFRSEEPKRFLGHRRYSGLKVV